MIRKCEGCNENVYEETGFRADGSEKLGGKNFLCFKCHEVWKESLEGLLVAARKTTPDAVRVVTMALQVGPDAKVGPYQELGLQIGRLVDEKNAAYGSSFDKSGELLRLLYPTGVDPSAYTDMLALVRVFDKMVRIATDKDAFGEDPWRDIAGYALLSVYGRSRM